MEEHEDNQYCFQPRNSSCNRSSLSTSIYLTVYITLSSVSLITVFLNLLVIISISHFKQLHTPTNLLILSLAVSDLLVGLIVIPAMTVAIIESCWILGDYFCALLLYTTSLCTSLSVGNLVLISIDRYVAVCDPLLYPLKITITRMKCFIFITWCCCLTYDAVLTKILVNEHVPSGCFEECYAVEGYFWVNISDFLITMVVPCSIIVTLYLKIFVVAKSQARKVFSKGAATVSGVETVKASKPERKAERTLAIVVFNYFLFWNPVTFLLCNIVSSNNLTSRIMTFLPLVNSIINPIIYAISYSWFRVRTKQIFTLQFRHK